MDIGERLPDLELETLAPGVRIGLWAPRSGAPLLLLPPAGVDEESGYATAFLSEADALARWDACPLLVVSSVARAHTVAGATLGSGRVALDPDGVLRRRLGLGTEEWGLFVADRWGVVYHAQRETHPEELPPSQELAAWARFLATQCPECGVIDAPDTGGWNPP